MAHINVPCSLLVGTDDHGIPSEAQVTQTHPLLPAGTPLVWVPGAGHLLPYEAPLEVADALNALVAH